MPTPEELAMGSFSAQPTRSLQDNAGIARTCEPAEDLDRFQGAVHGPDSVEARYRDFLNAPFFHNLDWLRGLAILMVLFHHVPATNGLFRVFQANGRYGVSLFFALSGFLICSLLLREERRKGRIDLKNFYIRRALRIFPLYYAVLALYAVLVYALDQFSPSNQVLFREKLFSYLFYFSNVVAALHMGPFFFAWSLAVEEQFYLAFGQLMRWLRRGRLVWLLAAALVAKIAFFNMGWASDQVLIWRIVFSYEEPILLGVLLAFALHAEQGFRIGWFLSRPAVLGTLGAVLAALLGSVQFHDQRALETQLLYLVMTLIIGGCCLRPRISILGNRLLDHIGKISYGIYLLHVLTIIAVKRFIPAGPWIIFLLSAIGVVILESVVYRYFEQPILRYKEKFSSR
jgi:peptidoglycan/LPS O-acetylase OafA/YrhL